MALRICRTDGRHHVLRALAGGEVRTAEFRGKQHLVVPVIALVEGVIHASNSEYPELVLASEFGKTPSSWNGRPVMMDHPTIDGDAVSANSPRVLERYQLGNVFAARIEDASLKVEAWLDPDMMDVAAASEMRERLTNGETVEVSVGVIVYADEQKGTYKGASYQGVWRDITPDHLAMLPAGKEGACSVEMGCGAPRAAEGKQGGRMKLTERLAALVKKLKDAGAMTTADGAVDGLSDTELSGALWNALFSAEPAFLGLVDIYPDTKSVVYCVAPDGEETYVKRSYDVDANGAVSLGDDAMEVKRVVEYQPVTASASEVPAVEPTKTAAAHGCACGGTTVIAAKEDDHMACKKELVKKILARKGSPFAAEDTAVLEQLSEARLTVLSEQKEEEEEPPAVPVIIAAAPATPPPGLTREQFLDLFPDIKDALADRGAVRSARKAECLAILKGANGFTEEELAAKTNEELEKLVSLSGKVPAAKATVLDFSGRSVPRAAQTTGEVPKPPSLKDRIMASKNAKRA